jgi:hypothetical protein
MRGGSIPNPLEEPMSNSDATIAQLAVEYWKLLRTVERAVESLPDGAKERFASQARYASGRLDALLLDANMSVQSFDGMDFEVNLPASPVNGEDFIDCGAAIVERTIEPAVILNMRPVVMGKVYLTKKG